LEKLGWANGATGHASTILICGVNIADWIGATKTERWIEETEWKADRALI
jgi:hypothetical protein